MDEAFNHSDLERGLRACLHGFGGPQARVPGKSIIANRG